MPLEPGAKGRVITEYRQHEKDTGSPEVQVALLTQRIRSLTEHLGHHKKDHAGRRGLLMLVGQRGRLLKHLALDQPERYKALIERLGLRK